MGEDHWLLAGIGETAQENTTLQILEAVLKREEIVHVNIHTE